MHELSFAQQVLDGVLREAEAYPGCRIVRVRLRAGEMLALEPASLRFCLDAIAVGTAMEGAVIEMEEEPLALDCPQCGRVPAAGRMDPVCPKCGQPGVVAPATDLIIEEIELDEQDGQT